VLDARRHLVGTSIGVFLTADGGATWQQVWTGGVAGPPLLSADGSIYWLLERGGGLVQSGDDGGTWKLVTGGGILASYDVVDLPDGSLASLSRDHVVVSDDQGATWRALGPALPPSGAYGLTFSASRNAIYIWQWDCGNTVLPGSVQRLDLASSTG
jgi:hypothetical protein